MCLRIGLKNVHALSLQLPLTCSIYFYRKVYIRQFNPLALYLLPPSLSSLSFSFQQTLSSEVQKHVTRAKHQIVISKAVP